MCFPQTVHHDASLAHTHTLTLILDLLLLLLLQHTGYVEAKAAGIVPELTLLTDITGSFRPGILTALMGVSGAGKVSSLRG